MLFELVMTDGVITKEQFPDAELISGRTRYGEYSDNHWVVDVKDLEHLVSLLKKWKEDSIRNTRFEIVMYMSEVDIPCIEIYNGYRE